MRPGTLTTRARLGIVFPEVMWGFYCYTQYCRPLYISRECSFAVHSKPTKGPVAMTHSVCTWEHLGSSNEAEMLPRFLLDSNGNSHERARRLEKREKV